MARPIGIDLFAGAGGLSLGFEQAGFDIVAAVDIDPVHCAVHKFNFPNCAAVCESVVETTGEKLRRLAGIGKRDIDVVVGGAPCQGFSLIGKRALDDSRNQLVHHYVRVVLELQPKYFVFENVKGLTVGKHRRFLQEIIEAFQEADYDVEAAYRVLNAADYGVPQDRRRLFLMGARKGLSLPSYPEPAGCATVGQAIGDIPDAELYPELWERDWTKAKFGKPSTYAAYLRGKQEDPSDFGYRRRFDASMLTGSLLTEHTELSRSRFAATVPGDVEPVSRFKRLALDGLCNTLRAGTASDRGAFTSPRPIHPTASRVITVREAARLHSYPDWFRFHVTKWHGFRQIGNSVPPMLARAVGAQIMKALKKKPEKPEETLALGDQSLVSISMSDAAAMFGVPSTVIARRQRPSVSRAEEREVSVA
ncbi:DNA cytosine methyltransferase [Nitrosomonas halophila]|uniref:Cytosine-specific methyltransferase n=1 Tax=Nitrosomonas halophila TaxID=44576 RepID=A0A1H3JIU2_9PROT|nr:DNA cytosine methyltransferase [Nitrosomonas halophila]SDY39883.1 DNA (cytosine-5)-methyltransferase 1 [Nitrosomonas halophila]